MNTCPKCLRPINEGNSPNLSECHAGDDDEDRQCELSAKIAEIREDRREALEIFCLTAQLMSGWRHDESWGEHDQSIYDRMIKLQLKWDKEQTIDNSKG